MKPIFAFGGRFQWPAETGETDLDTLPNGLPAYSWLSDLSPTLRAGLPEVDGCSVFTRAKAFVADQGVVALLDHGVRDADGAVVDLSDVLPPVGSASMSGGPYGTATLLLRVRGERTKDGYAVPAVSPDPENGRLLAPVPPGVANRAGIYDLLWVLRDRDERPVRTDQALLSVERAAALELLTGDPRDRVGPPSIREIRNRLRDTGETDNPSLGAVEFSAAEIADAIEAPVAYWNEALPPVRPLYTTATFPHRHAWLEAIVARLLGVAADWYLRNKRRTVAAGLTDDTRDRDREYREEATRLWTEYTRFVQATKYAANVRRAWRSIGSDYGRRY